MANLLNKIWIGVVLTALSIGSFGCQNARGYFGANDPALKYNVEVQKEDAERTVESLKGGVSIYVTKFD